MTEGAARPKARDLNQVIRYTMWSVFKATDPVPGNRDTVSAEVEELLEQAAGKDVVTRGLYDVAGFKADADYMFWWHAPTAEGLQDVYSRLRRTELGRHSEPVWSAMALHRPAEFNKSHIPAFLAEEEPRAYVCVYPFVRSWSGTSSTTPSAARCWPSTARWPATTPTCAPTPSPASRSTTTSGCSRSRPTSCTASST